MLYYYLKALSSGLRIHFVAQQRRRTPLKNNTKSENLNVNKSPLCSSHKISQDGLTNC